jgi:hypothetical protein
MEQFVWIVVLCSYHLSAHSLGLTAPYFFLWAYLKSKLHATQLHSSQELKNHIMEGIGIINDALLQQVIQKFRRRLQKCIECHGGHREQEILKSKV